MASANPTLRTGSALRGDTDDVLGHARADVTTPNGSLLHRLVRTDARLAPTIARLGLGLVMLPHALQKAFGWFGGHGFTNTYNAFTNMMHIPGPLAFLAIVTEIVCSIALVFGALTRLAAAGIIGVMLGAMAYAHVPNGFFMNWTGQQGGEGYEYHLLAIALGIVAIIAGGGRASVDRLLMRRRPMEGGSVDDRFVSPNAV
jgi:putative oxidoreductase